MSIQINKQFFHKGIVYTLTEEIIDIDNKKYYVFESKMSGKIICVAADIKKKFIPSELSIDDEIIKINTNTILAIYKVVSSDYQKEEMVAINKNNPDDKIIVNKYINNFSGNINVLNKNNSTDLYQYLNGKYMEFLALKKKKDILKHNLNELCNKIDKIDSIDEIISLSKYIKNITELTK